MTCAHTCWRTVIAECIVFACTASSRNNKCIEICLCLNAISHNKKTRTLELVIFHVCSDWMAVTIGLVYFEISGSRLTLLAFLCTLAVPVQTMADLPYRIYSDDPVSLPDVPPAFLTCACPLGCIKPIALLSPRDRCGALCIDCATAPCTCSCMLCDGETPVTTTKRQTCKLPQAVSAARCNLL